MFHTSQAINNVISMNITETEGPENITLFHDVA